MSISAVPKRLAATGVATALATGALVSGTTGTASAAVAGGATYTCSFSVLGSTIPISLPLTLSTDSLPTDLLADSVVPGGSGSPVEAVLGLPTELTGLLSLVPGLDQLGATLPGFSMLLGGEELPLEQLGAPLGAVGDSATLTGHLGDFKTPATAGLHDLSLPTEFLLAPLGNVPLPIGEVPCAVEGGTAPKVGTVQVEKQTADVKVVKAVKKGKAAKVVTKVVRQDSSKAAGKVAAFVKGKKVASKQLEAGRASLKVKNLKGASKVVVKYLGNSSTKAARKSVKLR